MLREFSIRKRVGRHQPFDNAGLESKFDGVPGEVVRPILLPEIQQSLGFSQPLLSKSLELGFRLNQLAQLDNPREFPCPISSEDRLIV